MIAFLNVIFCYDINKFVKMWDFFKDSKTLTDDSFG